MQPYSLHTPPVLPERVQLSRAKGWRMPADAVKVDRTTRWGNPYRMDPLSAEVVVQLFQAQLARDGAWFFKGLRTTTEDVRRELRGKRLACWCRLDRPCHADLLLQLANADHATAGDAEDANA